MVASDVDRGAVAPVLDALDDVLNGTTILVDMRLQPAATEPPTSIADALVSPEFNEAVLVELASRTVTGERRRGSVVVAGARPRITEIRVDAAGDHLVALLTSPESPHFRQRDDESARRLADVFLRAVMDGRQGAWRAFTASPDFLYSSGYYGGATADEPDQIAYFDGGELDSCLVLLHETAMRVLLTNGAP